MHKHMYCFRLEYWSELRSNLFCELYAEFKYKYIAQRGTLFTKLQVDQKSVRSLHVYKGR